MNIKDVQDFNEIEEIWNYYKLEDDVVIKLKIVLIRVIDEGEDESGNPIRTILTHNVVGVISDPTDDTPKQKDDLEIVDQIEDWNSYKIDDKTILKIKPAVSQINRLAKLDPKGYPVYGVSAQSITKFVTK